MKIVHLKVENLASVVSADIDFEQGPLSGEPIYLICGDTGAGKTTLLDAITIALYDEVSRYGGRNERSDRFVMDEANGDITVNNVLNIVRRGASSALAEVTFTTDDGRRYKAVWSVARARKKVDGRFQAKVRELHDLTDDDRVIASNTKECDTVIPKILGLTYEQFTKTVLLPQNQFAEFLRANKKDKSEILEMLVGNDIYSLISQRLHTHTLDAKRAKDEAEVRLGTVRLLTDDERQQLTAALAALAARKQQAQETLQQLEQQLTLLDRAQRLRQQRAQAQQEWTDRLADLTTLRRYALYLQQRDVELAARAETLAPYRRLAEYSQTIRLGLQHASDIERKRKAEAQLSEEQRQQLPRLKQCCAELAESMKHAEAERQTLDEQRTAAHKTFESMHRDELQRRQDELHARYKTLFEGLHHLQTRAQYAADEANMRAQYEQLEQTLKALPSQIELAAQKSALTHTQYEEADRLYQQQSGTMKDWVRACRAQLRPGDPCPVCGSREHHMPADEVLKNLIAEAEQHRATAQQQWTRAQADETALRRQQEEMQNRLKQYDRQWKQATQRLQQVTAQFRALQLPTDDAAILQQELNTVVENGRQTKALIQQADAANQLCQQADAAYTKAVQQGGKLATDHADALRQQALLEQSLATFAANQEQYATQYDQQLSALDDYFTDPEWRTSWQADPKAFSQQLDQHIALWNQSVQTREALTRQVEQQAQWQTQTEPYIVRMRALEPQWPHVDTTIADASDVQSETSAIPIDAMLADAAHTDLYRRLSELFSALTQRVETLHREAAELAAAPNRPADDITADVLTEQIAAARPALKEVEVQYYATDAQLKNDDEHRKSWSQFAQELERLQKEYLRWNSLDEWFGSNDGEKFRNVAQSWTLQLLLEQTNGILKSLCPRYELLCQSGSLVILVRDLADGGVVRVVNGVSGGETFILSLALSLALSQLNDNGLHIESLFIDEGFGSLSEDYLDNALSVLEQLHSHGGGRQIGIISHVPKLRERIPVHLCVERTDNYSSRVVVRTPFNP